MAAGKYNIVVEQGSTFVLTVIYKDSTGAVIDLTGYTARLQMRKKKTSSSAFIDVDSAGGEIVITAGEGKLVTTISATVTAAITESYGVYDLEIESAGGVVIRVLEGEVTVSKEVTR